MNKNNFLQKVVAKVSDTWDGDTLLMAEQMLPIAIVSVTRKVVANGDPVAERLLTTRLYPVTGTRHMFSYIDLNEELVDTFDNVFYKVWDADDTNLFEPVQSIDAMYLADAHAQAYYFWKGSQMFFKVPSHVSVAGGVYIEHYTFLEIDDVTNPFPEELEDALLVEMMMLMSGEQPKQMVEAQKP